MTERIVTAWAESASGPGWANAPVWYLVKTDIGYDVRCIQPSEQTRDMVLLYRLSQEAHLSMTAAVRRACHDRS